MVLFLMQNVAFDLAGCVFSGIFRIIYLQDVQNGISKFKLQIVNLNGLLIVERCIIERITASDMYLKYTSPFELKARG